MCIRDRLSAASGAHIVPMEYLVERFERLMPTQTENAAWFDTGLTFRSTGRPIYAYFERNLRPGALQPLSLIHILSFYWNQAVSAPGDSLSYAIGYLEIMELQGYAKAELGEAYTDMEFHRAVLEAGPSPFWHVRSYVEAYVERTKAEAPQGQTGRAA